MKKTLRILFALIFLLSLGSLTAYAQSETTSFAYIPLVSPASPDQSTSVPIEFRARQGFETLASKLLDAQARGQIVRFEPDFSFGMLKVEYVSGLDLSAILGTDLPIFEDPQSVLEYTQVGQEMMNFHPTTALANPWIYLVLYESVFQGGNLGANNYYKAYLKDTSGRLVATADGYIESNGWFWNAFSGIWEGMVPGYTFTFKLFNPAGTTLLNTYVTQIPRISITSINTSSKTIQGTAPSGSNLTVDLRHLKLDASGGSTVVTRVVTTSGAGAWQANFGTAGMRGGDSVNVIWWKPSTIFGFDRALNAPYVYCRLGGNYCGIYGIPGKAASLFIKHGGSTYTFTGKFDTWGWFGASLLNNYREPIFLVAGDQAGGTGVTTLTLFPISATPSYPPDKVTGKAPANRYVEVDINGYNGTSWYWYSRWVKSNSSRNYSADFSSSVDITPSDRLYIYVYYTDPATGNETSYSKCIAP